MEYFKVENSVLTQHVLIIYLQQLSTGGQSYFIYLPSESPPFFTEYFDIHPKHRKQ